MSTAFNSFPLSSLLSTLQERQTQYPDPGVERTIAYISKYRKSLGEYGYLEIQCDSTDELALNTRINNAAKMALGITVDDDGFGQVEEDLLGCWIYEERDMHPDDSPRIGNVDPEQQNAFRAHLTGGPLAKFKHQGIVGFDTARETLMRARDGRLSFVVQILIPNPD